MGSNASSIVRQQRHGAVVALTRVTTYPTYKGGVEGNGAVIPAGESQYILRESIL
jgi:hypothetical protein